MTDARANANRWLAAARDDLDSARYLASGGRHAPACFFAQQAAEKAVKAVHYGQGARSVIGHSVRVLAEKLSPRVATLDALIDAARELDLFYVPTRYPNGLDSGTPAEAFSAAQSARAIELAARFADAAGNTLGG
jgi:HEPN domain-containing protein